MSKSQRDVAHFLGNVTWTGNARHSFSVSSKHRHTNPKSHQCAHKTHSRESSLHPATTSNTQRIHPTTCACALNIPTQAFGYGHCVYYSMRPVRPKHINKSVYTDLVALHQAYSKLFVHCPMMLGFSQWDPSVFAPVPHSCIISHGHPWRR